MNSDKSMLLQHIVCYNRFGIIMSRVEIAVGDNTQQRRKIRLTTRNNIIMKQYIFYVLISVCLLSLTIVSCQNHEKQRELDIRERELSLKEKQLATNITQPNNEVKSRLLTSDAIRMAERKFMQYLPKIERSHDGILDIKQSFTGEFTGDGIEDVAIYFDLSPKGGGNAMVGQGLTLYQNTGQDVKVIAGFEPDYLFSFNRISNGRIYIDKLEYAQNDGRCCPSIKTEKALTISGSSVF